MHLLRTANADSPISTFAWFAANESTAKASNTYENIGVTKNTYSLGNITLTVAMTDFSGVKLSDTDGKSYVLVNGTKTEDKTVAKNHTSLYSSSTITVTASIQPSGEAVARTPTANELEAIDGNYSIKLVASNNAKVLGTNTDGEDGDDVLDVLQQTANNTIYALFSISDGVIGSISPATIYAGVQGKDDTDGDTDGNQPEVEQDFVDNKPTVTATLGTGSAANGSDWAAVATA